MSRLTGARRGRYCANWPKLASSARPSSTTGSVVEADDVWGFCGAKEKNATKPGQGDLWAYTAICADSKLLISWLIGPRSKYATRAFIRDLAGRMAGKVQFTTDGLHWCEPAVRAAFGPERCDYGQILKRYGVEVNPTAQIASRRYSTCRLHGRSEVRRHGSPEDGVCLDQLRRTEQS